MLTYCKAKLTISSSYIGNPGVHPLFRRPGQPRRSHVVALKSAWTGTETGPKAGLRIRGRLPRPAQSRHSSPRRSDGEQPPVRRPSPPICTVRPARTRRMAVSNLNSAGLVDTEPEPRMGFDLVVSNGGDGIAHVVDDLGAGLLAEIHGVASSPDCSDTSVSALLPSSMRMKSTLSE